MYKLKIEEVAMENIEKEEHIRNMIDNLVQKAKIASKEFKIRSRNSK